MNRELDPFVGVSVESFKNLYLEDYYFLLDSAREALRQGEEERSRGNVQEAQDLKNKAVSLEMAASLIMATAISQPVDVV